MWEAEARGLLGGGQSRLHSEILSQNKTNTQKIINIFKKARNRFSNIKGEMK
jgi:hypothetical protein